MRIRVPDYFTRFHCIADKCRDSCCIGWEIDVDGETRTKYEALKCDLGREIVEKTSHGCFPLQENGRCAFLDERGLCRIISELGDGYLCDICREHPRYYNALGNVTEGGLGLGCEEAARIILELAGLPALVEIDHTAPELTREDGADIAESLREALLSHIFTTDVRTLAGLYTAYATVGDEMAFGYMTGSKVTQVPLLTPTPITEDELAARYDSMLALVNECESLTDEWEGLVARIRVADPMAALDALGSMRGLIYYFTHRYVVSGVADMTLGQRVLFAFYSALTVAALCEIMEGDDAAILAVVAYSKNIEYSTDNVDLILEGLEI